MNSSYNNLVSVAVFVKARFNRRENIKKIRFSLKKHYYGLPHWSNSCRTGYRS